VLVVTEIRATVDAFRRALIGCADNGGSDES
jgi:hypothetical protein